MNQSDSTSLDVTPASSDMIPCVYATICWEEESGVQALQRVTGSSCFVEPRSISENGVRVQILFTSRDGSLTKVLQDASRSGVFQNFHATRMMSDSQAVVSATLESALLRELDRANRIRAIYPIEIGDKGWEVKILAETRSAVENLISELKTKGNVHLVDIELTEMSPIDWAIPIPLQAGLSLDELALLRLAYQEGYFDSPKRISLADLSEKVGFKHSRFHSFLAKAVHNLLRGITDRGSLIVGPSIEGSSRADVATWAQSYTTSIANRMARRQRQIGSVIPEVNSHVDED